MHIRRSVWVLIIGGSLLPATAAASKPIPAPHKDAVERAVRKSLKDPMSAIFDHSEVRDRIDFGKNYRYCVRVNSKNSYGGYTGRQLVFGVVLIEQNAVNYMQDFTSTDKDISRKCREAGM